VPGANVITAGGMGVVVAGHGPQHTQLVAEARGVGEQFADLQPRHPGGRRPKLAANLGGSVRLGIPGGVLRRTAHQKEQDARACPAPRGGRHALDGAAGVLGTEQGRQ
jgi:hypothetical protein